jgi:CDP-6-deoxy-D-xylo-4-hexulose-3-dehydrase
MQAAVGLAQLKKLPQFIETRRRNFNYLYNGLKDLDQCLLLPESITGANPSWFGFPITVLEDAPFTRNLLIQFLEQRKIATRLLFGGNLVRQPAYGNIQYQIASPLDKTDFVMNQALWLGVYPGLNRSMLDFIIETLHEAEHTLR